MSLTAKDQSSRTVRSFARLYLDATKIQLRVIGALMMREIHTRFGRDNIGYLWFVVEPCLLALGITMVHFVQRVHYSNGMNIPTFILSGYLPYMMFRNNFNRASDTIMPNRGLLYHRQVTIPDLVLSRTLLELVATTCVFLALLAVYGALGLVESGCQPVIIVAGMALMWWYTASAAMIITAAGEAFPVVERLVHPLTYLSLPVSGMVFLNNWLPSSIKKYVLALPMPHITELIRTGVFPHMPNPTYNLPYVFIICAIQTIIGYLSLKIVRRRVQL